jgi:hypothetical protein
MKTRSLPEPLVTLRGSLWFRGTPDVNDCFKHKSQLAGNWIVKHPCWNSVVSNASGLKLLNCCIQMILKFEHHNSPLNTLLREMVTCSILLCTRTSGCEKSLTLDLDHLPIMLHSLDHIRSRNLSDPVNKFTDWKGYKSLASELI